MLSTWVSLVTVVRTRDRGENTWSDGVKAPWERGQGTVAGEGLGTVRVDCLGAFCCRRSRHAVKSTCDQQSFEDVGTCGGWVEGKNA